MNEVFISDYNHLIKKDYVVKYIEECKDELIVFLDVNTIKEEKIAIIEKK